MTTTLTTRAFLLIAALCSAPLPVLAQTAAPPAQPAQPPTPVAVPKAQPPAPVAVPKDYVIGVDDVLIVVSLNEKDLSAEVVVRPDGKISVPMLNDVPAAGMTPEQLAEAIQKAATKFVRNPAVVTVMVKDIRSRKVFVSGEVGKPGAYYLGSDGTVMQILAEAGGLLEHAKKSDVTIVRTENGKERRFKFNYNDYVRGKNTEQNIKLVPGDMIIVR